MSQYTDAAIVSGVVLVLGLLARWYVTRKGGDLVSAASRRSLTGFVFLAAAIVGLAALAVALNPATTDTVVVSLVRSLPSLLLASVIMLISVLVGRVAAALIRRGLNSWSSVLALRIARFVKIAIVSTGAIIALDQLGVSTDLLIILVTAVVSSAALALALSFGLGTVPMARQVAAGRHVSDRFALGQTVTIGDVTGSIVDVGLASTRIERTDGSSVEIPHSFFLEQPVKSASDTDQQS